MNMQLSNAARVYMELKTRLIADEGLVEGEQTLVDTLEGCTDLHEQIAAVAREARVAETMAGGVGGLMKDMADRKARLAMKAERLRKHIAWAMQEAGFDKLPLPDMTLTMSKGKPSVSFTAEPNPGDPRFVRVKREWDKTAVRDALEAGEALPFATLGNAAPVLTIRTK